VAGRYALIIDDVEVADVTFAFPIGSNGFVIGAFPPSGGLTGTIDDFIVRKS